MVVLARTLGPRMSATATISHKSYGATKVDRQAAMADSAAACSPNAGVGDENVEEAEVGGVPDRFGAT